MLGMVFTIAKRRKAKFFTTIAGVWKQAVARLGIDLQKAYDYGKLHYKLEPHVIDSSLIAMWHANREKQWPIPQLLKKLSSLIEATKN